MTAVFLSGEYVDCCECEVKEDRVLCVLACVGRVEARMHSSITHSFTLLRGVERCCRLRHPCSPSAGSRAIVSGETFFLIEVQLLGC